MLLLNLLRQFLKKQKLLSKFMKKKKTIEIIMSEEDIILYNKTNCCHLCLKEIPHKNYRVRMADI